MCGSDKNLESPFFKYPSVPPRYPATKSYHHNHPAPIVKMHIYLRFVLIFHLLHRSNSFTKVIITKYRQHFHYSLNAHDDDTNDNTNNNDINYDKLQDLARLLDDDSQGGSTSLLGGGSTVSLGGGVSPAEEPGFKELSGDFLRGVLLKDITESEDDDDNFDDNFDDGRNQGNISDFYGRRRASRFERSRMKSVEQLGSMVDGVLGEIESTRANKHCSACGCNLPEYKLVEELDSNAEFDSDGDHVVVGDFGAILGSLERMRGGNKNRNIGDDDEPPPPTQKKKKEEENTYPYGSLCPCCYADKKLVVSEKGRGFQPPTFFDMVNDRKKRTSTNNTQQKLLPQEAKKRQIQQPIQQPIHQQRKQNPIALKLKKEMPRQPRKQRPIPLKKKIPPPPPPPQNKLQEMTDPETGETFLFNVDTGEVI